jgi:toxin FitB
VSYLLDTNVISEARKPSGDRGVKAWMANVRGTELFLSVLVLGEIRQGVERLRWRGPGQAAVYEEWLTRLRRDYADRILPVTVVIAEEWGRMNVLDPLPIVDGLMAATAKVHDLTFVTRNTRDIGRSGVDLIDPFGAVG